ncbi:MAG: hypothetical protein LC797_22115 [Chloroflexi bacterium]|nr:hypothetical protein [Chloroflexota bacterium]
MTVEQLRQNEMMAHLLEALEQGQDIGHYGRLVFAMVGHHFVETDELVSWLTRDKSVSESEARALALQVEDRDYSPPKRERILEWQQEQNFPILPHPDDPNDGNVYRDLQFPDDVYEHIAEYYEQKAEAREESTAPRRR